MGGRRQRRSTRGGDVQTLVEIELEEAFTGIGVTVPVEVAVPCERCSSTPAPSPVRRHGAARRVTARARYGPSPRTSSASSSSSGRAPTAAARARCSSSPAPTAEATGASSCAASSTLDVPPGIHDGQQIRVRDEGHAGFRNAERGHAFVVVRVRPDPRFVRDGDDLHTAIRLTMTDAALGTSTAVASLGGDIELDVAAGTQPGAVRALAGHGMPSVRGGGRGALYVRLDVAVPTVLDEEQRRLLEDVDAQLGPDAYVEKPDEDEGFFGRLKSALR